MLHMPRAIDQEKEFYRKLEKLLTDWQGVLAVLTQEGSVLRAEFAALADQDKMRRILDRLKEIEE